MRLLQRRRKEEEGAARAIFSGPITIPDAPCGVAAGGGELLRVVVEGIGLTDHRFVFVR